MRENHLSTVNAAYKALALVIADSDLDRMPVTYFEPTDLPGLPDLSQRSLGDAREETRQANRMRAASHLFLVAARNALTAALDLSQVSMELKAGERERLLHAIGVRSGAAGQHAAQASNILTGDMEPPVDESVVVSKPAA
jgi:hypothetical protein